MDTHKLRHLLTEIKKVSYWYFLIAFIISASICAVALRDNNLKAISLRNQLYQVDKQDGNTTAALNNLRQYVFTHMNTDLASNGGIYPPIQLKYTYQRLQQSQSQQLSTTNSLLYTQAEDYCQATVPNGFSGRYRVPCIENYITTHGTSSVASQIPTSLYEFDFVSPIWSPDLAGWSLIVSVLLFILFVIRFALELWLKHRLKQHA